MRTRPAGAVACPFAAWVYCHQSSAPFVILARPFSAVAPSMPFAKETSCFDDSVPFGRKQCIQGLQDVQVSLSNSFSTIEHLNH